MSQGSNEATHFVSIFKMIKQYNNLCNTFTPKIKGIQRVTYRMAQNFDGGKF